MSFATGVLVGLVIALLWPFGPRATLAQQGGRPAADAAIGRYHVFFSARLSPNASNVDCLLDSATGRVWVLKTKDPGGSGKGAWVPAVEAPK
jgi:hypothetical protein